MTKDELKAQLKQLEQNLEAVKAQFYRTEGAIQIVQQQITLTEKSELPKEP